MKIRKMDWKTNTNTWESLVTIPKPILQKLSFHIQLLPKDYYFCLFQKKCPMMANASNPFAVIDIDCKFHQFESHILNYFTAETIAVLLYIKTRR